MIKLNIVFVTGIISACCTVLALIFYLAQPGFLSSVSPAYPPLNVLGKILLVAFLTLFLLLIKNTDKVLKAIISIIGLLTMIQIVTNNSYIDEIYSKIFICHILGIALLCAYYFIKSPNIYLKIVAGSELLILVIVIVITIIQPYFNLWFWQVLSNIIGKIGFLIFLIAIYAYHKNAFKKSQSGSLISDSFGC